MTEQERVLQIQQAEKANDLRKAIQRERDLIKRANERIQELSKQLDDIKLQNQQSLWK